MKAKKFSFRTRRKVSVPGKMARPVGSGRPVEPTEAALISQHKRMAGAG